MTNFEKWKAKQMLKDAEDYGIHVPPSPCDFCKVRDCQKCLEQERNSRWANVQAEEDQNGKH